MWELLFKRGFVLPAVVAGVVPCLLGAVTGAFAQVSLAALAVATPLMFLGLLLLLSTTQLFDRHGGSLAPWNPPERMVIVGVYRFVRNPMIVGVFCVLAGEAVALRSVWIGLWLVCFVAAKHFFVVRHEEPALRERFGEDYARYCEQVPRWIPRRPTPQGALRYVERDNASSATRFPR